MTVSHPAGIGAPVMMRTHVPAATDPSNGWPANAEPATVSAISAAAAGAHALASNA